jgi:hypothetical protein
MLHMEPDPERTQLGFKEAVLSSFDFLSFYGLRPVQAEITLVRFKSAIVLVNVYHGRASFELGVEIARLSSPDEKVSLYDAVAWAGAEKTEGLGQHVVFQVSNRKDVQDFVPRLARLVEKYAGPFLRGDASAYQAVKEASFKNTADYVKRINLNRIRDKAETAWHEKNYSQVVELYSSMREDLTKVETGRVSYAEKQLQGNERARGTRSNLQKH